MREAKSYERTQTVVGCETMTPTQTCRFRELQSTRIEGKSKGKRKFKAHYSLKEAARLLELEADEILLAAAAGRLQCFVMSAGLQGHWRTTGPGELRLPAACNTIPKYLALTPADCRQIAAHGSINVYDLAYPAAGAPDDSVTSTTASFILRKPIWVDHARVVLKHPLPK